MQRNLKPVIINAVVGSAHGGMATMYRRYATVMSDLGFDVINVGLGQYETGLDFDVKIRNSGHNNLYSRFYAKRLMTKTRAVAVLCHCSRSVAAFSWVNKDTKVVGIPHSLKIRRFLGVDFCIAISPVVEDLFRSEGFSSEHIATIPNALEATSPILNSNQIEKKKRTLTIGYIGRLEARKGIDVLPDLVNVLKKKGVPVHLQIAGTGPDELRLKTRFKEMGLQDNVTYKGWLDGVKSFYHSVDLIVFPTVYEVMPMTIIEAFAHGSPVVTYRYEGFSIPFENDVNLVVVPDLDAVSWADAVVRLYENKEKTEVIRANAWQCFEEVFSDKAMRNNLSIALRRWGVSAID